MAKLKAIVTIFALAALLSACANSEGGKAVPPTPPGQGEQVSQADPAKQGGVKTPEGRIYLGRAAVPAEVAKWAEDNKNQARVLKKTIGALDAYLISLGERPTAGYEVTINEAGFAVGTYWLIDLSMTQPGPGTMAAQVITYPYEVFAVPAGNPVKLRMWNQKGEFQQLVEGQLLTLPKPEAGALTRTVRPGAHYFLYPAPEPAFLAQPEAMVAGGSLVEVMETKGEWLRVSSGEYQGWLPKWYLEGAKEEPIQEKMLDHLVLKEGSQGLLYPNGPGIVKLEKGKLLKPIQEWNNWYYVGIIVYDIPAVQTAWVPKEALAPIGKAQAKEGFLIEGTLVYGYDSFLQKGPVEPEKVDYAMPVYVSAEKDGYIAINAAGGWSAWTKKENLKFQFQ